MSRLLSLPTELIYEIAFELTTPGLNALCQTNTRLCTLLNPILWDPGSIVDATTSDRLHARALERIGLDTSDLFVHAAATGNIQTALKLLRDYDADINSATFSGEWPMAAAMRAGQHEFLQFLIDRGELEPKAFAVGLQMALNEKQHDVLAQLLRHPFARTERYTLAYRAIARQNAIALTIIMDSVPPAEVAPLLDARMLMHASQQQWCRSLLALLLDRGGDVNSSIHGASLLRQAAYYGRGPLVRYLVERGADLELEGDGGKTALDIALEEGDDEIVKYLRSKGAKEVWQRGAEKEGWERPEEGGVWGGEWENQLSVLFD
ncbi:hypothetical protein FQN50_001027 [Emmonsiellopsis sp. PD_5]|nr:hypothetical protein FQN50_001027 [Emmonsiellopsis sp. PD_5]